MTILHSGLSTSDITATGATIAAAQLPSGAIPWFPGGQTDPWDHVEAAMGLTVAGLHERARAAYAWLRSVQNPDGSWYRSYQLNQVDDDGRDANFTAYLAVGLLHYARATGDFPFIDEMWPTVVGAMGFVLGLQQPGGQIRWTRSASGEPADEARAADRRLRRQRRHEPRSGTRA